MALFLLQYVQLTCFLVVLPDIFFSIMLILFPYFHVASGENFKEGRRSGKPEFIVLCNHFFMFHVWSSISPTLTLSCHIFFGETLARYK